MLLLLPQVSTMTEMKSYSQAVTGVSTSMGRKWILFLGSGVFPECCGCQGGDGARLGSARSAHRPGDALWRTRVTLWRWQEWAPSPG